MQQPLTEVGERLLAHLRAAAHRRWLSRLRTGAHSRAGRSAGVLALMAASALVSGGTVAVLRPGVSTASSDRPASASASAHQGAQHGAARTSRTSGDRPVVRHVTTSPVIKTTAPPVRITIPVMGIDQSLVGLRVEHGQLQVPQDYRDVGWWSDGPAPGEPGAAVIVGHVDSRTGPAVFYGLSGIRPGAQVLIHRADGSTATFEVRRTDVYARANFPSQQVYSQTGKPQLHLLTCGGSYNRAVGHYDSNVVVSAGLVSVHRPHPPKAARDHAHAKKHRPSQHKHLPRDPQRRRGIHR